MCKKCVAAVRKHWPKLRGKQIGELLIGATAFPFADAETIEKQVKAMAHRSGQNLGKALWLADRDTERQMRKFDKERSRT